MSELQFEELKLWLFLVGVACADDNVFRWIMFILVVCSGLLIVTIRIRNHYKMRIEEQEKEGEHHENS
jgi:hypothetical protein